MALKYRYLHMQTKNTLYYIDLFLNEKSLHCEYSTTSQYSRWLTVFGKYLREVGKVDIKYFTKDTISGFKSKLLNRQASNETRNYYLNIVRDLGDYLAEGGIIKENPCLLVKNFKVLHKRKGYVYVLEHEQVLMQIKPIHPKLWGFLNFMLYGFWRPYEILNLTSENIGVAEIAQFDPQKTKGKRRIVKPISPKLEAAITELGLRDTPKGLYLFSQKLEPGSKKKLTQYVEDIHDRVMAKIGMPRIITLYKWRHTAARNALIKGVPPEILQGLMPHKSITQTMVYVGDLWVPPSSLDNL